MTTTLEKPAVTPSFPVFYDKSGKRLRRVVMVVLVLFSVVGALTAMVAPTAFAPTSPTPAHWDSGWPRQFLATGNPAHAPVIGEGPLTRVLRVEQPHAGTGASPGPDPTLFEPLPYDYDQDGITDEWLPQDIPEPPPTTSMKLIDPVTDEFVRYADDWEAGEIGGSPYVIEHFGAVPDHTLILTFDDGPDATYTPEILNVLSRERIPATFFVVGEQVVKHPEIVQRIIREGHMVANHTMTHVDIDAETDARNREEIIGTDRVIRAAADYNTRLFRMPLGDPDRNPLALLTGQQLGQIHVSYDLDTEDWHYQPEREVPIPSLNGNGHVVLLHDAGGDRAGTVRMLKKLIVQARAQGYTFTTLAPILPPEYVPQKDIEPSIADQATLYTLTAVWVMPPKLLGFLFWFGTGSLVIVSLLYLGLAVLNDRRARRRHWPNCPYPKLPFVSVVLAAYNEEKVITRTLDVLRESDYPAEKFEVVAVNDGSTDATLEILRAYEWDRLTVVDQPNSGKSSAINNGINHADPRATVIVTMDADTLFRRNTVRMLARHFIWRHRGKVVGAVAGHVKVGNRCNVITAWQSLEYISGICVTRMAEQTIGAIGIIPGACSAWRRSALEKINGFNDDTLAEDADATIALQRLGYAVVNENAAIADTEAPETVRALAKQRKRWTYGNIQVLWKYRRMLLRPSHGALGMLTLPYAAMSLLLPLAFLPFTVVMAALNLADGDWHAVAIFATFVALIHFIISVTGIIIARERPWHLFVVPVYRLIYEPLRAYLLYASTYQALRGTIVAWDKLERRNSVAIAGR